MIRICLVGPGNVKWHFSELLKIHENELNKHIEEIGKVLADNVEIVFCQIKEFLLRL